MIIINAELCRKGLNLTEENYAERFRKKNLVKKTNWRKIWNFAKEKHEKNLGKLSFNDNQQPFIRDVERKINSVLCGDSETVTINFPEPEPRNSNKRQRMDGEERINPLSGEERERLNYLEERNAELERKLQNFTVLENLFKEEGRRGNRFTYSQMLQGLSVELLSESISSTDLVKILTVFGNFCNLLDDDDKHVPRKDYFNKIRSKIERSLKLQSEQFLAEASSLMVSTDGTSYWGTGVFALGVFNQDLKWNCLELIETTGKSASAISEEMLRVFRNYRIDPDKLVCLVTDRARAQEAANTIFIREINNLKSDGQPAMYCICCLMHTVSNCDSRPQKLLFEDGIKVLSYLKQFFGNRASQGWSKLSLKTEFELEIGCTSMFETDIGSRYAVSYNNVRSLILHEADVYNVLRACARQDKHHELKRMMEDQSRWPFTRMELAIPFLVWVALLSPFHSSISGEVSYAEVKTAINRIRDKIDSLIAEGDFNAFERLLELAEMEHEEMGEDSKKALEAINRFWNADELAARENWQFNLGEEVEDYMHEMNDKFTADAEIIFNLPIDDDETKLPWTNRRIVSFSL